MSHLNEMIRGFGRVTQQERTASAKRPAALLDKGEIAIYRITYPSGKYLDVEGRFACLTGRGLSNPMAVIRSDDEMVLVLPGNTVTRAPGVQVWPPIKRDIER